MRRRDKKSPRISLCFCLACIAFMPSHASAQNGAVRKKRDPFVALVTPDGKIKTERQLFPPEATPTLSMNITLKAIMWDERRPLVLINNKVYEEGALIAQDLTVEKILPNSVVLNNQGTPVTMYLRKPQK